ncbi:MAG: glutamyl-tRNA reductase [Legionellales bacterium]|nr:glutamyl-tRNA reductase [Legionellales bacterium]
MPVFIIGFNHRSTSIDIREKLASSISEQSNIMSILMREAIVAGCMILSTCNRLELICSCDNSNDVLTRLAALKNINIDTLQASVYIYKDFEAFKHLLRVSSGLDSMLLGETQIFGQIKGSYSLACSLGFIGAELSQILPHIFFLAKQVRSKTNISSSPVSLAYSIVSLAKSVFNLEQKKVMLLGSGEIITKIVTYFVEQNFQEIIIANRTFSKAEALAKKHNVKAISLSEMQTYLPEVDIVISAVTSQLPIIGKGLVERAVKAKNSVATLYIDLGVPRNIEPEVKGLAGVYLYNIDNLQGIINKGLQNRQQAAINAEDMVEIEAKKFYNKYCTLGSLSIVRDFRRQIESVRDEVMQNSIQALHQGRDATDVLQDSLRQLTNKILHRPTVSIRKAIIAQREDLLKLTKDFFNL